MTVEWADKRWGQPGQPARPTVPDAGDIRMIRENNSTIEAETARLLSIARDAIYSWGSPNITAVATLTTIRREAGERVISEIRSRGYFAAWIWNGDGKFAIALDESAAANLDVVRDREGKA